MGSLFSRPKAPAPPPPPPNPQTPAKADQSLTGAGGSSDMKQQAGGTLLTSPLGTAEVKTSNKTLTGQ